MFMRRYFLPAFFSAICMSLPLCAADAVFSGPQPGEKTTGFKVATILGSDGQTERDPIAESKGGPIAIVFLHALERSLVPLLRVIDDYGALRTNSLRTEVVFLAEDRLTGEQRMKAAMNSLKLKSMVGVSKDGAEGPGNYGLNKECLMTVVIAKNNKVDANFALVQPGIADAPKIIEALAKVSGDTNPPTAEMLASRRQQPGMRGERGRNETARTTLPAMEAPNIPGAAPSDAKLLSLLRQFIRPTNDVATIDRVVNDTRVYIKGNPELTKQAVDGWTRVLHFGERYGTPYSRKVGAEFLEEMKKK